MTRPPGRRGGGGRGPKIRGGGGRGGGGGDKGGGDKLTIRDFLPCGVVAIGGLLLIAAGLFAFTWMAVAG